MPGKSAPKDETAEARFIRLANNRAANAARSIDSLGKLVGSQYKSTTEQHKKIFAYLREKMDTAERQLAANKPGSKASVSIL